MADFKYIMQGFQKDINFFDEIKEVLETEDYKRKGMVAYQQNNYVTSIRWGDVSHLLKNENLLGRELVIYKTSDKERYVIDIE